MPCSHACNIKTFQRILVTFKSFKNVPNIKSWKLEFRNHRAPEIFDQTLVTFFPAIHEQYKINIRHIPQNFTFTSVEAMGIIIGIM